MRALILAAGLGSRMRPLSNYLPKPLFPFANTPLLDYHIKLLKDQGIDELAINLHHLPDKIKEHLGDGSQFGVKLHYSYEPELLGTAGGIRQMADLLPRDTLVVLNSDMLTDIDLNSVYEFHRRHRALATMALNPDKLPDAGRGVALDEQYRIKQIAGRPAAVAHGLGQLDFIGIHIIEPQVIDYIPGGRPCCINREIYPPLIEQGKRICGYPIEKGFWRHVGTLDSYLEAHRDFLDGNLLKLKPGGGGGGGNAHFFTQAKIIPPVLIGDNCHIAAQAVIGPYAVLGNGCIVAEQAVVEHSVLWDRVSVGEGTKLNKCVVGHKTTINPSQQLTDQLIAS